MTDTKHKPDCACLRGYTDTVTGDYIRPACNCRADKPTPRTCSNCGVECIYQKAGPGADTPCADWKGADKPTPPAPTCPECGWHGGNGITGPFESYAQANCSLREQHGKQVDPPSPTSA